MTIAQREGRWTQVLRPRLASARGGRLFAILLISPTLVFLVLLAIYPTIYSFRVSLTNYLLFRPDLTEFVGLQNYSDLLWDHYFWKSLGITLLFTGLSVPIQFALGFGLALAIYGESRLGGLLRSALMVPLLISPVAVALTFRFLYAPSYGVFNYLLSAFHLPQQNWIVDPQWALMAVLIADTWQWTPFVAVILIAGLRSIPIEILEAAEVDGLPFATRIRWIMLPLLLPISSVVLLIRLIDSIRNFDLINIMTRGGPGSSTSTVSLLGYLRGFVDGDIGAGSAISWATLLLINILVVLLLANLNRQSA